MTRTVGLVVGTGRGGITRWAMGGGAGAVSAVGGGVVGEEGEEGEEAEEADSAAVP
ncbi:MAG: hypothetical protein WBY94_11640 [Polyangiaceae bacterium]